MILKKVDDARKNIKIVHFIKNTFFRNRNLTVRTQKNLRRENIVGKTVSGKFLIAMIMARILEDTMKMMRVMLLMRKFWIQMMSLVTIKEREQA